MSLDDILDKMGPFLLYEGIIYKPSKSKTDLSIKKKNAEHHFISSGKANDIGFSNYVDLSNFDDFVFNLLLPLLNSTEKESEKLHNFFFNAIAPPYNPVYFGKKGYMVFSNKSSDFSVITRTKNGIYGLSEKNNLMIAKSNFLSEEIGFKLRFGDYSAEKSGSNYIIKKKPSKIDLKYGEDIYRFRDIGLSIKLEKRLKSFVFSEPTAFKNKNHPFIYDFGKICFKGDDRWPKNGIYFKHSKLSTDLAYQIRQTFKITEGMLSNGYTKKCHPVRSISNFDKLKT